MCGGHPDWSLAATAARRRLKAHGIAVIEKVDPLDDDDFVLLSTRFADELSRVSGPVDRRAVQKAIETLDVSWTEITAAEQAQIISIAAQALGVETGAKVWRLVDTRFKAHAKLTIGKTKVSVGQQIDFKLNASFDQVDRNLVTQALKGQGFYVTSEYQQHAALFSRRAQTLLAEGLEKGLRSDEIARDMGAAAKSVGINRPKNYWNVTASAYTNRTRTHTQLVRYTEAGISRYEFQAIVDERTTDICRALDGKIFQVQNALASYQAVEDDKHFDAVKDHQPWVRTRLNTAGGRDMFIKQRDGTEVPVGVVTRSGVGSANDRGEYSKLMDNATLEQFGLSQPPLHGLCRSVIVPLTS